MKIHALQTGTVRVKRSFLHPRPGRRRQLDLLLPGAWSEPLPIHCWAVEHDGSLLLVDAGETATARDVPFARFDVTVEQELPGALAAAGLSLTDVSEVVLTHHHGDHIDGVVHVSAPVRVNDVELQFAATAFSRVMRRVLRQPLPSGFAPVSLALDDGPFGAFSRSHALSDDGRIVAVATPGHTPGHISVICIDDAGRHVMLAGDVSDTLEQLHARRADAVGPDPDAHVATLETILAHCAVHPTIYLPSHDPESAARLRDSTIVTTPAERTATHAVVVNLTITDPGNAARALHEELVPRVSQAPGFVTGYWTTKGNTALSMFMFDTEEAANRMSQQAAAGVPTGVVLDRIEVREVVARA
jgi:glyoxylase-like metal-dependent hydrolase (beta-lactamase superfamily II)